MGIANTTILTYDFLSEQYTQRQDFQNYTEVNIQDPFTGQTDPRTGVAIQEDNRFSLLINSSTTTGASPAGGIDLLSAGETASGYFAQYWDIDIVDSSEGVIEFEGVLQLDNRAEAIAVNTINTSSGAAHSVTSVPGINFSLPEVISTGTTIRGSFASDETEFNAIVEGRTLDGDYFAVEIYDDFV